MRTWLFHEIKYEGTSSNKIIAANRTEEKYKHTEQHYRSAIAAEEKKKWGRGERWDQMP